MATVAVDLDQAQGTRRVSPGQLSLPARGQASTAAVCKMCTIRLERLCFQRAWWFRIFRSLLATGVRLWSVWHPVDPSLYLSRSTECHGCIRFRKNVLKEESRAFRWLDGGINPLFNRARDSLLSPEELTLAKAHATRAGLSAGETSG